jgi:hypothetical protein
MLVWKCNRDCALKYFLLENISKKYFKKNIFDTRTSRQSKNTQKINLIFF